MRVVAFTKYDRMAASTRQRLLQYVPRLEAAGMRVDVHPLLDDRWVRALASGERRPWREVARSYARRLKQLLSAGECDVIWIYAELFPWLPAAMEKLAFRSGRWSMTSTMPSSIAITPIRIRWAADAWRKARALVGRVGGMLLRQSLSPGLCGRVLRKQHIASDRRRYSKVYVSLGWEKGRAAGHRLDRFTLDMGLHAAAAPDSGTTCAERRCDHQVSDLDLDGNLQALEIGGRYGDKGWQLPGSGMAPLNNRGSETVRNIHTHHHPLDGLYIDGLDETVADADRRLSSLRSEYNGRQGCSIVGGRGYRFEDCRSNHTGRAGLFSPPGAGVDIEAERGKANRDFHFVDCEFADNGGAGMVADSGDSEGATFERCKFVGTTGWAAWPKNPRFRFRDCTFAGAIVQTWRDEDPERAAQFHSCLFTDDPRLSPTGRVHARKASAPIADLGAGDLNVLFSDCRFKLAGPMLLPWSRHATYANCRMRQASPRVAYPRGTYRGTNSIDGNVNLRGSRVFGTLTVNGAPYVG